MISFFRRVMSSWIVLGLLGLLLVAFVVTGVGDPFGGGGPPPGSLAKVGDKAITEVEFGKQFDRFMRRAREQTPTLTNEQAAREGGVEQLLEQLIGATAVDQFGRKYGVAVSDQAVDAEIASIPAFQLAGKFDQATFERVLVEQRVTTKELRDDLRSSAVTRQVLAPIAIGAQAPRGLVDPYVALLLEQRRGSIAVIPARNFAPKAPPTAQQIEAFYKANQSRYTIPERRGFRYALLTKDMLAAKSVPTEAELRQYFEDNKDSYGGVEQRRLSQVVVQDQATAQKIAARAKGGEAFAAVAQQLAGYTAADLALGEQTREKLAGATSVTVAAAAFAAPSGGIVGPVQSDFGWHVLRVDAITPVRAKSFESVRADIEKQVRAEKAEDLLAKAVADIEDALTQGESLADVAKSNGLQVVSVPPLTQNGIAQDPRYQPDAVGRAVLEKAFGVDPGEEPSVQELGGDRFAILEVQDVVSAAPAPLKDIRPIVAAQWAQRQAMQAAKAIADAVAAEAAKGVPLAQALAKRGLPAPETVAGRRADLGRGGQQVPPPLALMFSLPSGSARPLAAPNDQGYFVVKVEEVKKASADSDLNVVGSMQAQMSQSLPDELAAQFARAVEADVGVKRSAGTIANVKKRYLGTASADEQ